MNHYDSETTGHSPAQADTESLISTKTKPKRPKVNCRVRAENPRYRIYCCKGKERGWLTRIFWDNRENCWKAHTERDEVMLGTDMICYLDREPNSSAEVIIITRVFASFCAGEVFAEN